MIAYETRRLPENGAQRYYALRHRGKSPSLSHRLTYAQIVSREHLFECLRELQQQGGPAPGPDGVRADDLSPGELGRIAQRLAESLQDGTYRPGPTRRCPIPKPDGGTRELRIANLCDKAVAKVLHRVLTPAYDESFSDCSWGFRPCRSAWGMLAELLVTIEAEQRWIVAVADIRRAFNHVPLDTVMEAHQHLLPRTPAYAMRDEELDHLLQLVDAVLRGADPERRIGIDQGNPYSPTALNVLLTCVHDDPLHEDVVFPLHLRYADNLVYPCRSVSDGPWMLDVASRLLQPFGLVLKEQRGVYDLRTGQTIPVMGLAVTMRGNRPALELHRDSWTGLCQLLEKAHDARHPAQAARESLLGWVESVGPAFEAEEDRVSDVLRLAARYGFRETSSPEELRRRWRSAHDRWETLLERAWRRRRWPGDG